MNFDAILMGALADPDAPEEEPEAPEPAPLGERLEAFGRYVELVVEQLRALEGGEVGRLRELMKERAALEAELGEEGDALLARALEVLDETVERDRELRDHWRGIQEDALRASRGLHGLRLHGGRYPPAPTTAPAQLDVRF